MEGLGPRAVGSGFRGFDVSVRAYCRYVTATSSSLLLGSQKHISISIDGDIPTLMGFILKGLYGISLSLFLLMCI